MYNSFRYKLNGGPYNNIINSLKESSTLEAASCCPKVKRENVQLKLHFAIFDHYEKYVFKNYQVKLKIIAFFTISLIHCVLKFIIFLSIFIIDVSIK